MQKFISLTFLLLFISGCGQDYNSNSGDLSQHGPIEGIDSSSPDGARLLAAYKVLQSKCFQCHQQWGEYKTSAAWTDAGKVTAGSLTSSTIWTYIKNNGGNMPPDPLAELTVDQLANIEAWITGM